MRKPEKLEELLNAAHNVVMRDGVTRLTLELVAREAGVSKGAVLYYFPTKNALIGEMLKTHLERNRQLWMDCLAQEPEGVPGRVTRAWINSVRHCAGVKAQEGAGMLAAIANDPALLRIIHERIAVWKQELENDGLPAERQQVIQYAMDGIKFSELMGMNPPEGANRDQLIDYLLKLATPGSSL
ncbi:TetR/AcrR family transcriptional regulator [Armatimonas sp.]|uniref:TetR/AcrR family transcriptional regulator n=1 Tax=Armatimonas sp. TaxID=1872638 RepID=UPI00286CC335|nr:TetR/AcrR family transcriptional regulator [Armatimonas sp.]